MRAHHDVVKKRAQIMTFDLVSSDQSEQTCIVAKKFTANKFSCLFQVSNQKQKHLDREQSLTLAWIPRLIHNKYKRTSEVIKATKEI